MRVLHPSKILRLFLACPVMTACMTEGARATSTETSMTMASTTSTKENDGQEAEDTGESEPGDDGPSSSPDQDESETSGVDDDTMVDPCGVIQCNPGINDCPDGQKCTPWRCGDVCCTNSTTCVEITGELGVGERCHRDTLSDRTDDCAPTLFCFPDGTGITGKGNCEQLCAVDPDGDGNCAELGVTGGHCFNFLGGSFPVCLETCDPLAQDCEGQDEGCYFAIDDFFCTRPTGPMGGIERPGKQGESCWAEQGCEPGLICYAESGDAEACLFDGQNDCRCAAVCDLSDGTIRTCADPWPKCKPFIRGGAADVQDVGVCVAD